MQPSLEGRIKELLGGALEHQFNRDECRLFATQRQCTRTW
jgi:hypothetical protein